MDEPKELSDYTKRGYAGLHIAKATRNRLNLTKALLQAQEGKFIKQDEFINRLLDNFEPSVPADAILQPEPQP